MFGIVRSARLTKALVRMAQPKPTSRIKCVTMIGQTTPPTDAPVERMPKAAPRLLLKYPATQLKAKKCQ